MKTIKTCFLAVSCLFFLQACFEDMDDVIQPASTIEIQDFIYQAMNIWYLYKPEVPDLANDRFEDTEEREVFLQTFATPEALFYDGLVADEVDRFSFLVEDYRELEASLAGISLNNGMEFGLIYYPDSETNVFGYVRYVIPNSDAANKGIERGMIFNTIDGTQLTNANYTDLLEQTTYNIGLATFDGTNVSPTGETLTLIKAELTENPIHVATTLDLNGQDIGYLMYNSFTANFDSQLNAVFSTFQSENISELVLDLRYNGGGSVRSAVDLSSMVTGQFSGEIFSTEVWNPELQEIFEQDNPEQLVNRFSTSTRTGEAINSLQLNRVYILTSASTASASELVINGLNPYIEVIQIGTNTTGKFQASTTFYDGGAPNFSRQNATSSHHYAIQPLIFTSANANGETDYIDGLPPTIAFPEDYANLGVLGHPEEPLLEAALNHIAGEALPTPPKRQLKKAGESKINQPTFQKMYVDPENL